MPRPLNEFSGRSEAEYEDALSRFPYPLKIVHGSDALAEYERLKARGDCSPIVIGSPSHFTMVHEFYELKLEYEPSTDILLQRAAELRFPDSYQVERARERELRRRQYPDLKFEDGYSAELLGEWPEKVARHGFRLEAAYDLSSRQPWPRTHIALIPSKDWTEIPAYLRSGGWNMVPESAHLVSALRSWRDRYGAELVAAGHDTMEFRVERPPTSRVEALALAREHYLFCDDTVGDTSLCEIAAHLIESDCWFFWWD